MFITTWIIFAIALFVSLVFERLVESILLNGSTTVKEVRAIYYGWLIIVLTVFWTAFGVLVSW